MRHLVSLSTVLAMLVPDIADACSPIGYPFHQTDPLQASDTTAPSAVTAGAPTVARFPDDDDAACGAEPLCGGPDGSITFQVTATDDATPADKLGYQLTVADGSSQPGIFIPAEAIRAEPDGTLRLHMYGDGGKAFDVDLEIRAVDLNGNLGPPLVMSISDPGEHGGGCATSSRVPSLVLTFALLALAVVGRRCMRPRPRLRSGV